jgi:hypothetical protein
MDCYHLGNIRALEHEGVGTMTIERRFLRGLRLADLLTMQKAVGAEMRRRLRKKPIVKLANKAWLRRN